MLALADPRELARSVVAGALAPRPTPPPDAWLAEHRRMNSGVLASARSGKFDLGQTPYLRGFLRACGDPAVREVAFQKSAGVGFTEALIGLHLYQAVVLSRSSIMLVPNKNDAGKVCARRVVPAVEATLPAAAALTGRPRDVKATEVAFRSAVVMLRWVAGKTETKSIHVPFISNDEFDESPEGTHERQRSRVQTFAGSLIVNGGTPMDAGAGIEEQWLRSDRRRYLVPCPHTGQYFELWDFALVRWEGSLAADPTAVERDAWVQSPFTPEAYTRDADDPRARPWRIHNHHKPWMVRHGVWVREGESVESDGSILEEQQSSKAAEQQSDPSGLTLSEIDERLLRARPAGRRRMPAPEPSPAQRRLIDACGVRIVGEPTRPDSASVGFRVNALASLFNTFGFVARGFVEHKGSPPPDWFRERLGQAWQPASDKLGIGFLRKRCVPVAQGGYTRGTAPEWMAFAVCTVDTQNDHVWALWTGFSADGMHAGYLDHARIDAAAGGELAELRGEGGGRLFRRFVRAGAKGAAGGMVAGVPTVLTAIDHGARSAEVVRFTRWVKAQRRLCLAVKGDGTPNRYAEPKMGQTKEGEALLHLPVNRIKDELVGMLAGPEVWSASAGEVGYSRFYLPEDCPDEYLAHLVSEERVRTTPKGRALVSRGRPYSTWQRRKGLAGLNNHLWDDTVYAVGAVDFIGCEALRAALTPAPAPQAAVVRAPEPGPGTRIARRVRPWRTEGE